MVIHLSDNKDLFDIARFYTSLDAVREARAMNWKQVSEAAQVNASTLSRMAQGQRPDANALAALGAWSGLNPADFVRADLRRPDATDTLTQIAMALARDTHLSAQGAAAIQETVQKLYSVLRTK